MERSIIDALLAELHLKAITAPLHQAIAERDHTIAGLREQVSKLENRVNQSAGEPGA